MAATYTITIDVRTNQTSATPDYTYPPISFTIVPDHASSVLLSSDKPSPQIYGTPVTFTAAGQGASSYEYRFWLDDGTTNTVKRDYSTDPTWKMTKAIFPAAYVDPPLGTYTITVDVRTDLTSSTPDASVAITSFKIGSGVTFTAGANGTVTPTASLAQGLNNGDVGAPVTANPSTGYHFVNWTGDNGFVTTTVNPLIVTGDGLGHAITANFAIDTFTVTFITGANGTLSPASATTQTVNYGDSTAAITAVPNALYHFVNWTGYTPLPSAAANPLTLTNVTASYSITANFDVGTTMVPDGNLGYGGTTDDAMLAMQLATGSIPTTAGDLAHGDVAPLVNGRPQPDGKIDIGDVIVILRKALGLITW